MSRTYKDKSWKYELERNTETRARVPYIRSYTDWTGVYKEHSSYIWLDIPGVKTKKPRTHFTRHYMSTPSWWTRLMMGKPQRREGRIWERKVLFQDLQETDPPQVGCKPHIYFY